MNTFCQKKITIFDNTFINFTPGWQIFEAIIFFTKKYEGVKMDCFRAWDLLGVRKYSCHAHNTGSWYLLGVLFKISDEYPRPLYQGILTPGLAAYVLIIRIKFEGVLT